MNTKSSDRSKIDEINLDGKMLEMSRFSAFKILLLLDFKSIIADLAFLAAILLGTLIMLILVMKVHSSARILGFFHAI
jgi:hypothetical protein